MAPPAALAALLLACIMAPAAASHGLSPPWWITYDMFQAALRSDRCLNVSELAALPHKPEFRFNVTVCAEAPEDKLVGLATFLTVRYDFGGQLFSSRVLDSQGKPVRPIVVKDGEHAMNLAGAALQGNPYFDRTAVSRPLPCIDFYWVVLKPEIVQIWVDNLADLWGNINLLAADLFARVFRLEQFGVRATTLRFGDMADQPGADMHSALPAHSAAGGVGGGSGGTGGGSGEAVGLSQVSRDPQRHLQPAAAAAAVLTRDAPRLLQPAAAAMALQQEQQDVALVAALRQRWQEQQVLRHGLLPGAGSSGRQLLDAPQAGQPSGFEAAARPAGSGHSRHSSRCWRIAAKCWALRFAKQWGGDAAVLKVQRWVL